MTRRSATEPNWLLIISFFLAGIFLGGLGIFLWLSVTGPSPALRLHPSNNAYRFINPLLAVDSTDRSQITVNADLELGLSGLIDTRIQNKSITQASVYIKDIEAGQWVGIKENDKFSPGKMLKIPIMIAFYKLAQNDPQVLDQTVDIAGGQQATVGELIQQMIQSDTDVEAQYLFDTIDKRYLNEVYSDLGVDFQEDKESYDFISTKLYSLFFRVLYNATYLNREMSEKALETLSHARNDYGIGSSLPGSLVVSHSKGYRQLPGSGLFEMRDCGVVYYPKHPYVLCIMGRGAQLASLKSFIADASGLIYQDIDYKYRNK